MRLRALLQEGGRLTATPELLQRARDFVWSKWKDYAEEKGKEAPEDLSDSCKFSSLFAHEIFGGEIRGNKNHQFNVIDGRIVDLNSNADDVDSMSEPYRHDAVFWNNPQHHRSLESCMPRVREWVTEFLHKMDLHEVTGRLRVTDQNLNRAVSNKHQVFVHMDPNEFLRMTTRNPDDITTIKDGAKSLLFYNRLAKSGEINVMPFLDVNIIKPGLGKIRGHEGRHRAASLIAKGGQDMPVVLRLDSAKVPPKMQISRYMDPIYGMTADDLPEIVQGQYNQETFSTKGWKVIQGDMLAKIRNRR